jgi:hypothetical protein
MPPRFNTDPSPDLFGHVSAQPLPPPIGEKKRRKTVPKGYAAAPGTGPKGETCKTCVYIRRRSMGKTYLKCGKVYERWTGGPGTDILASAPACAYWDGGIGFAYEVFRGDIASPTPRKVLIVSATETEIVTTGMGTFGKHTDGTWRWGLTEKYVGDCFLERITLKDPKP